MSVDDEGHLFGRGLFFGVFLGYGMTFGESFQVMAGRWTGSWGGRLSSSLWNLFLVGGMGPFLPLLLFFFWSFF